MELVSYYNNITMNFIGNILNNRKIHVVGNYTLRCASYKDLLTKRVSYGAMILIDNIPIWSESKVVKHEKSIHAVNYIGIISGLNRAIELNITTIRIETDNDEIIQHLTHFTDNNAITYNYYDTTVEIILSNFDDVYFSVIKEKTNLFCYTLAKASNEQYNEMLRIEKQKLINKLDFYEL